MKLKFALPDITLLIAAATAVITTSGCATAFVRSGNAVEPDQIFPATALDAHFFWNAGIKGESLLASVDPNEKNSPLARLAYAAGSIIDLPFSIALDTVLLPIDLVCSERVPSSECHF